MNTIVKFLASTSCLLVLSACGGGDSGTPAKPDQSWLAMTPASSELTTYEGESLTFAITAKSSKTFTKPINIAIVDSAGVISTDIKIASLSSTEYAATLQTSTVLTVGTHSTKLELRLCEDDPRVCKTPVEGSPWLIPVTVTVKSNTNLTPLRATPFMPNWSTFQGNASHTGYVPASFDVKKFSRRWSIPASVNTDDRLPVVHDSGKVFGLHSGYFAPQTLIAWSEDTGKEAWRVDLGSLHSASPPAAADGKVYVATGGHQDTFFWVFDQATGQLLSKKTMSSQWPRYMAPTILGDAVYTNSGYYGGMSKFSTTSHDLLWETTSLPQYDGWTPAVDGTHAYSFIGGALYAVRTDTGATAFTIADPDDSWSGYTGLVPVLSGKQTAFVVNGGRLVAFDLTTKSRQWTANGSAVGYPVYAKDVVYVLNAQGTVLEAHSATTGALLWTSNSLGGTFTKLLVTDNLAFISSGQRTLAINLATRQVVWEYAVGGEISISNRGVLYIGGPNRKLAAVNLE